MDPGAHDAGIGGDSRQGLGDQRANGREDERAVELDWRRLVRPAGPAHAQLVSEPLRRLVTRPHEREDVPALSARYLRDEMSGGSEAIDAERPAFTDQAKRAVADNTRAQQWRDVQVVITVGQLGAGTRVGDGELGVAAVDVMSREPRGAAEVLSGGPAILALATHLREPPYADASADREALYSRPDRPHPSDDFVSGNHGNVRARQFAVDDVEIGSTDSAGRDGH